MKKTPILMKRVSRFLLVLATMSLLFASSLCPAALAKKVLIVMDEREAMENLAAYLKEKGDVESTIVDQSELPEDLSKYDAVIAYIHKTLEEKTELAIIDHTKKGGRYICLHHSISSKKSLNKHYFDFLGIQLDNPFEARKPTTPGGDYAWRHPVDLTIVNVNPDHYITSHHIDWNETVSYRSSDEPSLEKEYPAFTLEGAEFYLNHKFTDGRAKTVLLGFKTLDDRNGITFMQDRAAWIKKQGKGHIIYFKMGDSVAEFKNPNVDQLILNALMWTP